MCQPSPLGRCSTDATTAYENAEIKLRVASSQEREDRFNLKTAHDNFETVKKANPEKPAFGSKEDRELKDAKKNFEKAIASWDTSKAKRAKAEDDVLIKRMHLDTTPAGKKALIEDADAEDRFKRMELAATVTHWQSQVKEITDSKGNPITSKEGKQSPESYEAFSGLYKNAQANFESKKALFEEATAKTEVEKKKSRDYERTNSALVERQDEKAYKSSQNARYRQLQMLMFKDRMDDLSKIIQKRPANSY